jgi:fatty-acyl-CoA synthase
LSVALLRFDLETSEPRRNSHGFCEHCLPNEIGEAVGLMPEYRGQRAGRFKI